MPTATPRRSPDELARLGGELYDRRVRPSLQPADDGKFVAIDVGTGDYELDEDDHTAVSRLLARSPGAELWLTRAAEATAYRVGRGR
jgi:hypothetical protein